MARTGRLRFIVLLLLAAAGLAACGGAAPAAAPADVSASVAAVPAETPAPPMPTAALPEAAPTPRPAATATVLSAATATADTSINPLTGQRVANASALRRRPLEVCVGNDPEERPHYGLSQADIVFEYLMERFYNTRLTAVYLGQEAERIGPVRSARPANLELAAMYDALLACSGSSEALRQQLVGGKKAFDYNYVAADRDDPQYDRYFVAYGVTARANTTMLSTSTASLRQWLQEKKREKPVPVKGFTFSAEPPGAAAAPATSAVLPYPSGCCAVEWRYDPAGQRYLRLVQGAAHVDQATRQQISAANVVIVYAQHRETDIIEDALGAKALQIVLTGEGKATVVRDGVAMQATWSRRSLADSLQLSVDGKTLALRPGNTWVEIVPDKDFEVVLK